MQLGTVAASNESSCVQPMCHAAESTFPTSTVWGATLTSTTPSRATTFDGELAWRPPISGDWNGFSLASAVLAVGDGTLGAGDRACVAIGSACSGRRRGTDTSARQRPQRTVRVPLAGSTSNAVLHVGQAISNDIGPLAVREICRPGPFRRPLASMPRRSNATSCQLGSCSAAPPATGTRARCRSIRAS